MKNSRRKGKTGELEFVHLLGSYGYKARRGQQFKGTPDSPDIICEDIPHIHFEVKRTERFQLYKFLDQAAADCSPDQIPVVAHRQSRQDWVIVIPAKSFFSEFLPPYLASVKKS